MSFRWDKFLWSVRLTKTRSQATEELAKGRIKINGQRIKPSKEPKVGDLVQRQMQSAVFTYEVLALLDKRVGAKLVHEYLLDRTSKEEKEKWEAHMLSQKSYRIYGTGKPTKRDRRNIDEFLQDWN